MSSLNKITIERNQKTLLELVVKPGNDICADCKARNPRWASHNLGIFICMGCASIHRKIGTHITKVKSITMDAWTKEQVESMKSIGNIKSNAIYNPNELRYPPPPNLMDAERDSELEQYIRSKYEYKRFFDKSALVASKLGSSRSASSVTSGGSSRSVSTPLTTTTSKPHSLNSTVPKEVQDAPRPSAVAQLSASQPRSVSQPLLMMQQSQPRTQQTQPAPQPKAVPAEGVWADLVSLQAPATNSSLPLQFQPSQPTLTQTSQQTPYTASLGSYQTGMGMGVNPFQQQTLASNPFSQQQQQYSTSNTQPFSAGGISPFSPTGMPSQQQQYFSNQTQAPPPMSAPQGHFFQPQPQQGHLQIQVPALGQTSFPSPIGQNTYMSAPVQGQFMSSSPGQQLLSHSPQPQMQMMSTTPQPQMQTPGQQNQYMTHSPQPGMGMGMLSSTPQGQFLSTTPQPQMQMQMPYMTGIPQQANQMMSQPQSHFGGGFQGQGQQPFAHSNYGGQQWGAM